MAYSGGDYFNVDMQESNSTSLQPINKGVNAKGQLYTDDETALNEAMQNDNTYQELNETPDMGQRSLHKTNLLTNCKQAPAEVSETSPNKCILVCLTVQSIGVILALGLAAYCIIIIQAQAGGDGVSNRGIVSAAMPTCKMSCMHGGTFVNGTCVCLTGFKGEACHEPDCLEACQNGGLCMFGFCRCLPGFRGEFCELDEKEQQKETGSSSYIRWGRSGCPESADLAYTGYAAGTHWSINGSGSNYLCLHHTPEYNDVVPGFNNWRAHIDGVEYEVSDFPPFASQHNHDMNCAVCRVATRGTMVTIPARLACPSGWTREYYGYLMSSKWDHKRTEFICVDHNPEAVPGTYESEAGSLIFPVEVRCLNPDPAKYTGGLPCDKFPDGNELSCVVCTK